MGHQDGHGHHARGGPQVRQIPPGPTYSTRDHALRHLLLLFSHHRWPELLRRRVRGPGEFEPEPDSPGAGELPRGPDHALLQRLLRVLRGAAWFAKEDRGGEGSFPASATECGVRY